MPEWLYEEGIGENRAILVEDDAILEAAIEIPSETRVGAVVTGHIREFLDQWRLVWVHTRSGDVAIRNPPEGLTKGQLVRVEILREEILEPNNPKSLIGQITDDAARDGPTLAQRIGAYKQLGTGGEDLFEQAGWSDLLEEAISGDIPFDGGELRVSLTPAMTLIDVDGRLPPAQLAVAGARAAAQTIRRHGITGSIGVDLPTTSSRQERHDAAAAFDAVLPKPFERTAVNGFGFMQIVRKRERESVPEMLRNSPVPSAARALLRRAERTPGVGARLLIASSDVIDLLQSRQEWLEELRKRIGAGVRLQVKTGLSTWSFHVQAVQS